MTVPEILNMDAFDECEWAEDYGAPMAVDTQSSQETAEADSDHVAGASTDVTQSSDGETEEEDGMDEEEAEAVRDGAPSAEDDAAAQIKENEVRYWSDYSRVFFHPRSLQRLPDLPEWEIAEGNWSNGLAEFANMEEVCDFRVVLCYSEILTGDAQEHDVMEQSLRPFVEECDNLQVRLLVRSLFL